MRSTKNDEENTLEGLGGPQQSVANSDGGRSSNYTVQCNTQGIETSLSCTYGGGGISRLDGGKIRIVRVGHNNYINWARCECVVICWLLRTCRIL